MNKDLPKYLSVVLVYNLLLSLFLITTIIITVQINNGKKTYFYIISDDLEELKRELIEI